MFETLRLSMDPAGPGKQCHHTANTVTEARLIVTVSILPSFLNCQEITKKNEAF